MKQPALARSVIRSVRGAIKIPLTIKIRTGWEKNGDDARIIARIAETEGVDAIAIHPRLASQGFKGRADWQVISDIKGAVSIPVMGNGDIVIARDAIKMVAETGCDAVMVGRAAIGNPWIFGQINALLRGRDFPETDLSTRFFMMKRYLRASVVYFGEEHACYMMRSRLAWFVKGLPHAKYFRESIKYLSTEKEALELIESYRESIH